ncbi:MAG: c-type cytochrome [bacterium]
MKKVLIAALVLGSSVAMAGDIEAGKAKSAVCAGCHGANGKSAVPIYPNLAGQHAQYIVTQLKAFKAGERKNPIMAPMAAPLTDADMENLAAYFESQK